MKYIKPFIFEAKGDILDLAKLQTDVEIFRKRLEHDWDWNDDKTCLKGHCGMVSEELEKFLQKLGYNVVRVRGYYLDAEDEFEPDTHNWEFNDIENYNKKWERNGESAKGLKFPHWWIEVGSYIVDVTEDQFHPSEADVYRIGIHKKPVSYYKKG